jgi:3-hydroxyisobutyrate dehydrogenase-like beta-hydroxyacid dehydrogenase
MSETVGLIGLGLLGGALAERFLAAGLRVAGYDLDPARCTQLARHGGTPLASEREVIASYPRTVLSLPDSDVVEAVLREATSALRAGQIILDTTTGDPDRTTDIGLSLAQRGIAYLDATVLGSSEQARRGEVLVMVGGDADAVADCRDLLDCFAAQVFHVGRCGAGSRMKLVVNLVLGLNRAVLAEGLAFARVCGVDPAQALEVLCAGAAYSRVMDTKGRKMLDEDFTPQARLAQHLKDVQLILTQGARRGAKLPLSTLHAELLAALAEAGFGDADNAAIIKAFE